MLLFLQILLSNPFTKAYNGAEKHRKLLCDKGRLDLLNIVMIGLAKEIPEHSDQYELHRLLGALLSQNLTVNEKIDIIGNLILSMYKNGISVEQIAAVTDKNIAEVQKILEEEISILA